MFCLFAALLIAALDGVSICGFAAFVKRFIISIRECDFVSDSKNNQDWSKISLRLSANVFRDFRLALTLNDETAQDVLSRAVADYIAKTPLPHDTMLGKPQQ